MAGRVRQRVEASLFPFLSVLLCAMGVLIVVVSGQSFLTLSAGVDIVLHAPAHEEALEPVYVECAEHAAVLHPDEVEVPLDGLADPLGPLARLLDRIRQESARRYVVLLVRPDGYTAFQRCLEQVQRRGIQVGKEALLSGGKVVIVEGAPQLSGEPP